MKLKILIAVLVLGAVSGLFGGISGVKGYRYSSATGTEVILYDPAGRAAVFLFGIASLSAAVGCWKRRKFGWFITLAMMLAAILITIGGIITILAVSWSRLPTAIWWSAQTVAMGFLVRWWLKQRQQFEPAKAPEQSAPAASGR